MLGDIFNSVTDFGFCVDSVYIGDTPCEVGNFKNKISLFGSSFYYYIDFLFQPESSEDQSNTRLATPILSSA